MQEVETGVFATRSGGEVFEVKRPVFPTKQDFEALKEHFTSGDEIWYFEGADSGWAIVRNRTVVWVLVTDHEY